VTVPIAIEPSRNVTVPLGVPEPGATARTVAVKVTLRPATTLALLVFSATELADGATACVSTDDVLDEKFAAPL
jgi:hypothetical protein